MEKGLLSALPGIFHMTRCGRGNDQQRRKQTYLDGTGGLEPDSVERISIL